MIPETGNREQFKQALITNAYPEPLPGEMFRTTDQTPWCSAGRTIIVEGAAWWPLKITVVGLQVLGMEFFLPFDLWQQYTSNGVLKFIGYDDRKWNP